MKHTEDDIMLRLKEELQALLEKGAQVDKKEGRAAQQEAELADMELREKCGDEKNTSLHCDARSKRFKSKLTPLIPNEKQEVTIHAGELLAPLGRPSDLSQKVFGCYCNAVCSSGFFIPMTLLGQYRGKYCVWYTQFGEHSNRYHYGQYWTDCMNKEKSKIVRTYISNQMDILTSKDAEWSETLFLVFGREGSFYRFFGVFEIEQIDDRPLLTIVYKKIADSFTYKLKKQKN